MWIYFCRKWLHSCVSIPDFNCSVCIYDQVYLKFTLSELLLFLFTWPSSEHVILCIFPLAVTISTKVISYLSIALFLYSSVSSWKAEFTPESPPPPGSHCNLSGICLTCRGCLRMEGPMSIPNLFKILLPQKHCVQWEKPVTKKPKRHVIPFLWKMSRVSASLEKESKLVVA